VLETILDIKYRKSLFFVMVQPPSYFIWIFNAPSVKKKKEEKKKKLDPAMNFQREGGQSL
jgi:nicotinamide riboside transporter PnuC